MDSSTERLTRFAHLDKDLNERWSALVCGYTGFHLLPDVAHSLFNVAEPVLFCLQAL